MGTKDNEQSRLILLEIADRQLLRFLPQLEKLLRTEGISEAQLRSYEVNGTIKGQYDLIVSPLLYNHYRTAFADSKESLKDNRFDYSTIDPGLNTEHRHIECSLHDGLAQIVLEVYSQ